MNTESDVATIQAIFKEYDDAIMAGDLEGYLSLFVDDCVVLPPNAKVLLGKDSYRSYARPIIEQFDMEEAITVEETQVAGDWAFARGSFKWLLTPKAGGEAIEEIGKAITILKRQPDGVWKISRNIWNSDHPPAGEDRRTRAP